MQPARASTLLGRRPLRQVLAQRVHFGRGPCELERCARLGRITLAIWTGLAPNRELDERARVLERGLGVVGRELARAAEVALGGGVALEVELDPAGEARGARELARAGVGR